LSGRSVLLVARELRRLPAVEDVAEAVEFLLGDRSAGITGTVLTVDAGSTAQARHETKPRQYVHLAGVV
jgi:enoyl-[acyl-carrier-protein] reductase (NADH)